VRIAIDHREAILLNAARLFARKPFHEVLMDDVAVQAGIAKGTIYRYYPNKDDLFAALSIQFLERIVAVVEHVDAGGPLENIHAMIRRSVEFIAENHDFFRVMQRRECEIYERKGSAFGQRRSDLRELYAEQIRAAERLGLLDCPFGTEVAADMLLGMVRNILRFTDPMPSPERIAEMVMHTFLRGLGARPLPTIARERVKAPVSRRAAS